MQIPPLLTGRVVLVAGAGPGLGRQVPLAAARAGADVVVCGRTAATIEGVAAEVVELGASAVAVPCDVTDAADCRAAVAAAEARFGGLDSIVFNAFDGGAMGTTVEGADMDRWRAAFDVNVVGAAQLVQHAAPALRRRGGGTVVLVGSQISRRAFAGRGDYATTKTALLALVQVLARELGPDGTRVNAVVPGRMRGPALLQAFADRARASGTTPEDEERKVLDLLCLPRLVTDEEVARSVLYLCSELSAGVTGQSLDVNAGETFH
jgi:NAD(P)-dependent dehydrogenase (short-subunit alcohol dehydrogenase family)